MTYVLITRPQLEGIHLKNQLTQLPGFCEPMLQVIPLQTELSFVESENKVTDIIVTSARVLEIVENWAEYTHLPIWCVGEVTGQLATEKGFTTVYTANRSAQDLLEMIVKETGKEILTRRFVHVCGDTLHLDLSEALSQLGYRAEKLVIYHTKPITAFTKELIELLKKGKISLAPFFSQRTAEIFVELVKKHKLEKFCQSIVALAHSQAVAEKLGKLQWAKIDIVTDIGAEKIHFFHGQLQQERGNVMTKENFAQQKCQNPLFKGSIMAWYPAIGLVVLFIMFLLMWGVCLPNKLASLHHDWINQQEIAYKSLSLQNQKLMADYQKNIRQELTALKMKLIDVEKTIPKLPPYLTESIEKLENMMKEQFSQTRSEDLHSLVTYQKWVDCSDHLKKTFLSEEDHVFLMKEGILMSSEEEVLSIPQLLHKLDEIDFVVYLPEIGSELEGASGEKRSWLDRAGDFLRDKVGVQIQKKRELPLKESLKSDLRKGHFSLLTTLPGSLKSLPEPLRMSLQEWHVRVLQTKNVLDKITDRQKLFSDRLGPPPAGNPHASVINVPSSEYEGD